MTNTINKGNNHITKCKTIHKTMDGIKYYSNEIHDNYQFWISTTHPSYKHFTKLKFK